MKGNTVYAAGHTLPPESNTDDLYFGRELTGDYQSLCNGLKKEKLKVPNPNKTQRHSTKSSLLDLPSLPPAGINPNNQFLHCVEAA